MQSTWKEYFNLFNMDTQEQVSDETECWRNFAGLWLMQGICSLRVLVLHGTLLVPVLMYGSEKILWKDKRSRIRAIHMHNLRGLLDIRIMERVLNARIRVLCGMTEGERKY